MEKTFSRRSIPKLHIFDQIFKKYLEISKQKGHLLPVLHHRVTIYSDISLYKKGTFSPFLKMGGACAPRAPPVPTPLLAAVKNIVNIENDSQGGLE